MPRPGPRRKMVGVKLSDDERAAVDARAEAEGLTWAGEANTSEALRIFAAYAVEYMPSGWRPGVAGWPSG